MRKGGIIFYSIYDKDMIAVGNGQKNWALDYYVDAFKSVAPAKMFVCMTFEAEFLMHNNPSGRTSYASPAEYRQCALHAPERSPRHLLGMGERPASPCPCAVQTGSTLATTSRPTA